MEIWGKTWQSVAKLLFFSFKATAIISMSSLFRKNVFLKESENVTV